jgi:hypothetical protein
MAKYKDPNSWSNGGNKRRDFQHTHDGPEELPSKKKSKKSGRKKARCEHEYELMETRDWFYRQGYVNRQSYFRCKKCKKKRYELVWVHEEW